MKENILSWSLANFVSVALMLGILWIVFGLAGHVFIRGPARKAGAMISASSGEGEAGISASATVG